MRLRSSFPLILVMTLAAGSAQPLAGQGVSSATIRGTVRNPAGHPLALVRVELVGSGRTASTTPSGRFAFAPVAAGRHQLQVVFLGFEPVRLGIMVHPDTGWGGEITLEPATLLPELVAEGRLDRPVEYLGIAKYDDFFRRQKIGFGTFRTRAEIERMGATDVLSVLRGVPGVRATMRMDPSGAPVVDLRMARCDHNPPKIAVYIDGNRVLLPMGEPPLRHQGPLPSQRCEVCEQIAETLAGIPIRDVELVEFYRGVAQIPSDIERGDNCAALIIWTR